MKFLPLLAVGACANQVTFTADPNDAMNQLSAIMTSSQMVLGKAQRHHQKLIDKMRKAVETNFNEESEQSGEQIGKYAIELANAEKVLQTAIDSSVAGLKEEEKAPSKVDDWEDPGVSERAQLYAQLNAANHTLQHLHRAHDRAVRQAEDGASQAFEDASMKLSMKLGDLTDNSENAKKHLSEKVDKIKASFVATKSELFVAHGKDQQTRLHSYEQELKESQHKSTKAAESAKKSFSSFLGKSTKDVEAASDKVIDDLAKAQEKEIAKVLKHQPTLAPMKKKKEVQKPQATTTTTTASKPKSSKQDAASMASAQKNHKKTTVKK